MEESSARFELDPAKDAINVKKHGVTMADIVDFDWSDALVTEDTR